MTKKKISVKLDDLYIDLSYVSLDAAIADLVSAREYYTKQGITNLQLEPVEDYNGNRRPEIFGERLETDAEYAKRLADEAKWKAHQEERDRKEFERLSKQFGKK